jgi:peroxiredoxin
MVERRRQIGSWQAVIAAAVLVAVLAVSPGCKKKPDEAANPGSEHREPPSVTTPAQEPVEQVEPVTKTVTPTETPTETPIDVTPEPPKPSLRDVIARARNWAPAYASWHGKEAPEFTATDLDGKVHKLSDYRGKNVMLVFWATWCPPCRMEIPHLNELRKTVGEDKLAILALTYEKPEPVKKFVEQGKINYKVLLEKGDMPVPFGVRRIYQTTGIPSSFFVKPDGKIKLATSGLLRLPDMQGILEAE